MQEQAEGQQTSVGAGNLRGSPGPTDPADRSDPEARRRQPHPIRAVDGAGGVRRQGGRRRLPPIPEEPADLRLTAAEHRASGAGGLLLPGRTPLQAALRRPGPCSADGLLAAEGGQVVAAEDRVSDYGRWVVDGAVVLLAVRLEQVRGQRQLLASEDEPHQRSLSLFLDGCGTVAGGDDGGGLVRRSW